MNSKNQPIYNKAIHYAGRYNENVEELDKDEEEKYEYEEDEEECYSPDVKQKSASKLVLFFLY